MEKLSLVLVASKPTDSYVLDAIILFNQGTDTVTIKGRGPYISKAVDVYNKLKERLGESLHLDGVVIGSERRGRRISSFIEIRVRRVL